MATWICKLYVVKVVVFLTFKNFFFCWYVLGRFGYRLLLKIENWKYYNKIIFKYMNSIVKPMLEVIFAERGTCGCGSRK